MRIADFGILRRISNKDQRFLISDCGFWIAEFEEEYRTRITLVSSPTARLTIFDFGFDKQ